MSGARQALVSGILGLVAAALLAAALQEWPVLQRADQRLHDTVLAETAPQPAPVDMVLVDIDEQSLATLGPWPWPRTVLAQMAQRLRAQGARVQVWDLLLSHPTEFDDAAAAALVRRDVVFGQVPVIDSSVLTPPLEGRLVGAPQSSSGLPCSQHATVTGHLGVAAGLQGLQAGHIAATPDADGRLRRVPAVVCHQGLALPQLALATAQADEPQASWVLESGPRGADARTLRRGRWAFSIDSKGWMTVPYERPHRSWPVIRAEQLLDADARLPSLQGKVVLVGATALGMGDVIASAREAVAPGVSVHAELIAGGLQPSAWPLRPYFPALAAAAMVLMSALVMALLTQLLVSLQGLAIRKFPQGAMGASWGAAATPRRGLALGVVAAVLPLALSAALRTRGWLVPAFAPTLALAAAGLLALVAYALHQRLESLRLRRHLESFMPTELADRIVAHQRPGESLGEPRTGVVLALRVPGIERWMAQAEPQQALGLLHAIHATAQAQAAAHGGRVDHAQGHTLLVMWATPTPASAQAAVAVAHACWAELLPVLRRNETEAHPLGLEAAVESGSYWVGVVGTPESRRPVVLGAVVVDVMAMLELHAELAAPILVGERVSALLAAPAAPLGRFVLPGQARPKTLHRVDAPLPAA
jgi:CHASE2 domain-containing sensor protein